MSLNGLEGTRYVAYLNAGGALVILGENNSAFSARNTCLINFVNTLAGGGTIGAISSPFPATQTVVSPFTGPNSLTTVSYQSPGLAASPGAGSFISTQVGGGTPILFAPGTLSHALTGALIVIFDASFLDPVTTGETNLAKNIIVHQNRGVHTTALIVNNTSDAFQVTLATNLSALLVAAGYTVTVVQTTPSNLSIYDQVWDIRYSDTCPADPVPTDPVSAMYKIVNGSLKTNETYYTSTTTYSTTNMAIPQPLIVTGFIGDE